jgi:hypothetical protein
MKIWCLDSPVKPGNDEKERRGMTNFPYVIARLDRAIQDARWTRRNAGMTGFDDVLDTGLLVLNFFTNEPKCIAGAFPFMFPLIA